MLNLCVCPASAEIPYYSELRIAEPTINMLLVEGFR